MAVRIGKKRMDLCSKCGSIPEIVVVGDNKTSYIVRCPKCGWKAADTNRANLTVQGAIRVWNKECRK